MTREMKLQVHLESVIFAGLPEGTVLNAQQLLDRIARATPEQKQLAYQRALKRVPLLLGDEARGGWDGQPAQYPHPIGHSSGWPRIRELPEPEREPFRLWLSNQTRPLVEDDPKVLFSWEDQDFFYTHDYLRWKATLRGEHVEWD